MAGREDGLDVLSLGFFFSGRLEAVEWDRDATRAYFGTRSERNYHRSCELGQISEQMHGEHVIKIWCNTVGNVACYRPWDLVRSSCTWCMEY